MWRVAFFGRLEERKGIKLFVDAVQRLPQAILDRDNFEAYFVGAESKVDQQLSSNLAEEEHASLDLENVHHGQHAQVQRLTSPDASSSQGHRVCFMTCFLMIA